jgi:hypothetical protein
MAKFICCLLILAKAFGMREGEYFLLLLVDARKLDYSNTRAFLRTLVKHPSDGSKNGDVGHAWIYLKGKEWVLEGGHTGEFGQLQPKYLDGVISRSLRGEANPAAYLWQTLYDGRFQRGSGGHKPTFALKVGLTEEQFEAIRTFIRRYDFETYSLTKKQCVHFVMQVAQLAGLSLEAEMELSIAPQIRLGKRSYRMWSDPAFAQLQLASPDRLEESLVRAFKEGKGECALEWYLYHYPQPFKLWEAITLLPKRLSRVMLVR